MSETQFWCENMTKNKEHQNCAFCYPRIENYVFAQDACFLAAYNIAPILPGHVLIVPRRHLESVIEFNKSEIGGFFTFAQSVTQFVMTNFQATGFDWTIQEGEEAGQSVPHVHLHVIPRRLEDLASPGDWYPLLREVTQSMQIDDDSRPRLADHERETIVSHLKKKWEHRPSTS